jgi:hypothetical protein
MSTNRDFDRIAGAWLAEGPSELADRVLDAALDEVHLTNQRRRIAVPWRLPPMNTPLRLAAGIAAFAVVGLAALGALGNGLRIGGPSTPSPSTQPSMTPPPASFEPLDTTDWVEFTSVRHGYEARHPSPYHVKSAVEPLPFEFLTSRSGEPFLGGDLRFVVVFDHMYDTFSPADSLYPVMGAVSTRLPDGMSEEAWLAVYRLADARNREQGCIPPRDEWQPVSVDGVSGGLYTDCSFREVLAFAGGRAYTFTITRGMGGAGGDEDLQLLLTFVSTVTLHPDRADDSE